MGPWPNSFPQRRGKSGPFKKTKPSLVFGGTISSNRPTTSNKNRFSSLSDLNDMDIADEAKTDLESRDPKPPPLVADIAVPFTEIQHILGQDCTYKRTSIGTKIFPSTFDKYEFCKKALIESKIDFHSYNQKANRLFTTFLHGLPRMNPDEIIEDLKSYNLTPSNVTEVITKFSSRNDAVYKVQFVRKNFSPVHLKEVKVIKNVIVSWKKQKPRNSDRPTQCWRCLMFGHGGEHCFRTPACMICANNHHTDKCPFKINDKKPAAFSCFNCKKFGKERTDHSANDISCPLRAHYLEIRANATSKKPKRVAIHRSSANQVREDHQNPTRRNINTNFGHDHRSYAAQLINNSSNNNSNCNNNINNSLFNIDELFNIFTTALDELSQCTTKSQQMYVIMSLIKHAYEFK